VQVHYDEGVAAGFQPAGHGHRRPDWLAGHVGLEVRRETGKE
jgi:hypothetical protein